MNNLLLKKKKSLDKMHETDFCSVKWAIQTTNNKKTKHFTQWWYVEFYVTIQTVSKVAIFISDIHTLDPRVHNPLLYPSSYNKIGKVQVGKKTMLVMSHQVSAVT